MPREHEPRNAPPAGAAAGVNEAVAPAGDRNGLRALDYASGQHALKPYDARRYEAQPMIVKAVTGSAYRMVRGERVPVAVGDVLQPGQSLYTGSGSDVELVDTVTGQSQAMGPDAMLQLAAGGPEVRSAKTQVLAHEGTVKGGLGALDKPTE